MRTSWPGVPTTVTRPEIAATRRRRIELVDHALKPLETGPARIEAGALDQLKVDLAIIVSAEALFTLTDLCGLSPDNAIASAVRTARTVTTAAMEQPASD